MFLELTSTTYGKMYINVNDIKYIISDPGGVMVNTGENYHFVFETLDQIKAMLQESYISVKPSPLPPPDVL